MDPHERVIQHFHESIHAQQMAMDQLMPLIVEAGESLARCLQEEGKVLSCGNGGSAAATQHFAALLLNRFELQRPGLPAIALGADSAALTSIADDIGYRDVFARQVRALGHPSDVLLAVSATGYCESVTAAVQAARERRVRVVALTGRDGGALGARLGGADVEIRVPAQMIARIHEVHMLVIHCLCDLIDQYLFNPE